MGPYPGYAPSYQNVRKLGGMDRTCLVVELLSATPLPATRLAQLADAIDTVLAKHSDIEHQVVLEARFDTTLRRGLRLGG